MASAAPGQKGDREVRERSEEGGVVRRHEVRRGCGGAVQGTAAAVVAMRVMGTEASGSAMVPR